MQSDLSLYVRTILRWSWVTVILVTSTVAVIMYSNSNVPLVYESSVKLQVSAPESEEVGLFSVARTGTVRDEITAAQADFSVMARGAGAAIKTMQDLGLKMSVQDFQDRVLTEIPAFSDFVVLHVQADNPADAAAIARVHTENALKLYGEARARTPSVRSQFIADQLSAAVTALAAARAALLRFQTKNGVTDLSRDIQQAQDGLRTLRQDRDRNMTEIERAGAAAAFYTAQAQKAAADNDTTVAGSYRTSAATNQAIVEGMKAAVTRQNELIAQRENELQSLVSLTSENDRIRTELAQAEGNYTWLQSKLNEARIKESDALGTGFIQIVEPAQIPSRAQRVSTRSMLIPGIAAAVVAGIILSFVLEYAFGGSRRRKTATSDA